jgi:serine/threonine protein kinase
LLVSKDSDIGLKLADFGFAVRLSGSAGVKQQAGTPGYVSPEVLERKPHSKPVDMWSMGVVLFMLLGGYPPFYEPDNNTKNMYRRIMTGDYFFHPDYWAEISPEAKDLIKGLLTVDPARRLTVDQALTHPWIKKPKEEFSLVPLTKTVYSLLEFRAKVTFAKANNAIANATIDAIRKLSSTAVITNNAMLVNAMASNSSTALTDVAIDVMRKLSNTNLDSAVIEAARKKSGANLASGSTRRTNRVS